MAAGFELTPADLSTAAAGIEQARVALQGDTQALQSTISGAGSPWGSDEQGTLFGMLYQQVLTHVAEVMESHQAELDYAAGSLQEWDRTHAENDAAVGQLFTALGQGL